MMQSFISSNIWIAKQHALQSAGYLQGRSCARGHVGLTVAVVIALLQVMARIEGLKTLRRTL
ncbi:hypothetical protein RJ639_012468 [Escallonia herrerae]|uniref:Uncharacterized protein n=1 Tax=Escallonia herrerae TaxID=1293975 RepID=A0AA88VNX3_9ASTE|nr:hypothetical protein RJ639_012468 [Escallonia herrerae]